MTARLRALLFLAACIAAAGSCRAQALLPADAAACVARIEQQSYATDDDAQADAAQAPQLLVDVCPELVDELNDGVWGRALTNFRPDGLSAAAFVALTKLAAAYQPTAPAATSIATDSLDAALAEVRSSVPPTGLTLWERAMNWLQERLGPNAEQSKGWLDAWLEDLSVSERWARILVIALGVVLAIATVAVVVNELREAGILRRRRRRAGRSAFDGEEPFAEPALRVRSFEELKAAPLARQPALLLALVLEHLRRRAAIPPSSTHRELLAAGVKFTTPQRAAFATVVGAAERATFGGWQPAGSEIDGVLASGESLLHDLAAANDEARS